MKHSETRQELSHLPEHGTALRVLFAAAKPRARTPETEDRVDRPEDEGEPGEALVLIHSLARSFGFITIFHENS